MPTPTPMRRILTTLLSLTLAITLIVTSQASPTAWNAFLNSSDQWMKSVTGLFTNSQIGPVVSAQQIQNELSNWQTWPSARKHKGLEGGGWTLPFEAFQQQYYRGWVEKNRKPGYTDSPLQIDLNGDGLQDLLYSKGIVNLHTNNYQYKWGGVEQYIILRRANGFELAYKCRQEGKSVTVPPFNYQVTEHWYYGDCADTSYVAGTDPAYELPWSPGGIWYQQTPEWHNSKILKRDNRQEYMGTNENAFDYLNIDMNINSEPVETIDRNMPKITDLNGDGLPDIVFFGNTIIGQTNSSMYGEVELNFVLYNNGHGFDIDAACISRLYDMSPNNKLIPSGAVSPTQEVYCR